jgi:hypothetical protein
VNKTTEVLGVQTANAITGNHAAGISRSSRQRIATGGRTRSARLRGFRSGQTPTHKRSRLVVDGALAGGGGGGGEHAIAAGFCEAVGRFDHGAAVVAVAARLLRRRSTLEEK